MYETLEKLGPYTGNMTYKTRAMCRYTYNYKSQAQLKPIHGTVVAV